MNKTKIKIAVTDDKNMKGILSASILKIRKCLQRTKSLSLATVTLGFSLTAAAQATPPFNVCTYDNTNGVSGAVSVYNAYENIQLTNYQTVIGSVSGSDGLFSGNFNLKNVSGSDYSDVTIILTEAGYWSQTYFNNNNFKFTWNPTAKWWTKTATDGTAMTIRLYNVAVNGTYLPASQVHMVPVALTPSAGYSPVLFESTADMVLNANFYDAGTGITHNAAAVTPPTPANYITIDLGPLANGQSLNNIVITYAVSYADGRNPYTLYPGDGSPSGDIDYYVFNTLTPAVSGYDYGDAPASYGIARHAPHATNVNSFCPGTGAIYIGPARPDYELSNKQSAACNGDDTTTTQYTNTTGYTDEGGTLTNYTGAASYSMTLPYVNNSGASGTLSTWIDWNNNGIFDASEMALITVPAGSGNATLTWRKTNPGAGEGTIPASVVSGNKVVRSRIGTILSEINIPTGTASDGEVEDCLLSVAINPLPITLVSFTGNRVQGNDRLSWTTTKEQNSMDFEIEYSVNGADFTKVGTVNAAGTTTTEQQYHFTNNNVSGTSFYRLKTVYTDGSSDYSQVIKLTGTSSAANGSGTITMADIYPVPFHDELNVGVNSSRETPASIRLFTLDGKKVAEQNVNLSLGLAHYAIHNLSALPAGMYVVRVQTDAEVLMGKVIK
ncbi:T9SS type A sorting domain-containing protein [Taibaiella soli]|nr:T9SS type A sorting domain-containing protein [Taibaiella soli]